MARRSSRPLDNFRISDEMCPSVLCGETSELARSRSKGVGLPAESQLRILISEGGYFKGDGHPDSFHTLRR